MEEGSTLLTEQETSRQITLLTLIKKKGAKAYHTLFQVIQNEQRHYGHKELSEILLSKYKGQHIILVMVIIIIKIKLLLSIISYK